MDSQHQPYSLKNTDSMSALASAVIRKHVRITSAPEQY